MKTHLRGTRIMKRVLLGILLTSGLWVLIGNFHVTAETPIPKEPHKESELFHTKDALGKQYTLIKVASNSAKPGIIQLPLSLNADVDTTFPLFFSGENAEERILANEIIISFDEQISLSQKQVILKEYNLKIIRPLRFSANRYLVKFNTESGRDIFKVANQLSQKKGVKSATPNLIVEAKKFVSQKPQSAINRLKESQTKETNLLAQQWHLNSNPFRVCLTEFADDVDKCLRKNLYEKSDLSLPRTDIHAVEAWRNSKGGKGVLVAVLDGLIQWNHPDLINNVYTVGDEVKDKLKGEKHGWDFVNDDEDTRISQKELAKLIPILEDMFSLSDDRLLEKYSYYASTIKKDKPFYTKKQIADKLRENIGKRMAVYFHGTWVSGIIAANYQERLLSREQIISILKQTASYNGLTLSETEKELYKVLVVLGKIPPRVSIEQYFFGNGLVNAHRAVKEVQRLLNKTRK